MDKAMSGKIGKKWAAIFAACVWAIFALAASVAFRTVTAKAASADEVITAIGIDLDSLEGENPPNEATGEGYAKFTFGKFYRGMQLLSNVKWETKNGSSSGTIELSDEFTSENVPAVSIGMFHRSTSPDSLITATGDCEHDFTANAGSGTWNSTTNGHYAVCSKCGFKLEVAHRPALDGSGKCADCGEPLGDDYINKYSFTLPDDTITWDPQYGATIEITINYINVFAGFVLKLNLDCAGALKTENGAEISYTVAVSTKNVTATTYTPTGGSGAELIWEFHASNNLSGSDMRTNINSASITVTLRPSGGESSPYAGTYTDTLTFSVTLETE